MPLFVTHILVESALQREQTRSVSKLTTSATRGSSSQNTCIRFGPVTDAALRAGYGSGGLVRSEAEVTKCKTNARLPVIDLDGASLGGNASVRVMNLAERREN